jgi:hypothetical protein
MPGMDQLFPNNDSEADSAISQLEIAATIDQAREASISLLHATHDYALELPFIESKLPPDNDLARWDIAETAIDPETLKEVALEIAVAGLAKRLQPPESGDFVKFSWPYLLKRSNQGELENLATPKTLAQDADVLRRLIAKYFEDDVFEHGFTNQDLNALAFLSNQLDPKDDYLDTVSPDESDDVDQLTISQESLAQAANLSEYIQIMQQLSDEAQHRIDIRSGNAKSRIASEYRLAVEEIRDSGKAARQQLAWLRDQLEEHNRFQKLINRLNEQDIDDELYSNLCTVIETKVFEWACQTVGTANCVEEIVVVLEQLKWRIRDRHLDDMYIGLQADITEKVVVISEEAELKAARTISRSVFEPELGRWLDDIFDNLTLKLATRRRDKSLPELMRFIAQNFSPDRAQSVMKLLAMQDSGW